MLNKFIPILTIMLLLVSVPCTQAATDTSIDYKALAFSNSVGFIDSSVNGLQKLGVENGLTYDASNDSTEQRGTENWEESQSSFFIFPGIVIGIMVLVFVFNRE